MPDASGIKSSTTAQATPGIEPGASWPPSGVNAFGIQHNRALFDVPPVVRYALLVSALRIMGGYVWRPCRLPHARCCHACSTASQCTRAKSRASAFVWSGAARRCGPHVVARCIALPFGRLAACGSKPLPHPPPTLRGLRRAPSAPASGGSPVFLQATTVESSRRVPSQASTVLTASRVRFAAQEARALDPAARGAGKRGQTALAVSAVSHQGENHETHFDPG